MRRAERDGGEPGAGRDGGERPQSPAQIVRAERDDAVGCPSLQRGLERRRLGREADRVEHGDRAG